MILQKFRFGLGLAVVTSLFSSVSYLPQMAHAQGFVQGGVQPQTGFRSLSKQQISIMPNNALLTLRRQLKLLSTKPSLPKNYRASAKAQIPLVNAEIKRRGLRVPDSGRPRRPSQDVLAVLHNFRDSSQLTKSQLKRRLARLERLIDARGVKKKWKRRARAYRAADNAELQRRRDTRSDGRADDVPNRQLAVLKDRRPLSSLSRRQLKNRVLQLQNIISNPNVAPRHVSKASRLIDSTRTELRRRRVAGNGDNNRNGDNVRQLGQVLNDQRPARDLNDQQLRRRMVRLRRVIDTSAVSPRWKARARQMYRLDRAERARRRDAVTQNQQSDEQSNILRVLNDRRPSQRLSKGQLRGRLARLERFIDSYGIDPQYKSQARSMRRRDQAELQRRRQPASNGEYGNSLEENRLAQLLADRRLARNLSDQQLRARVGEIRKHMRRHDIRSDVRSRLSRKLVGDRAELRRRVAAQNNPYDQGPSVTPASRKLAIIAQRLLNDYRSSRQLRKKQLRKRIRDAREVLLYAPLPRHQISQIKRLIKADRVEKRSRLLAARESRRIKLQDLRRQGRLRFDVAPHMRLPQGNDISGAEANDRMIRRQFLAKDGRSFARKYSRAEIARRPELTRRFGGIDIDTIKFGFNEYWVREEEVDEIERMAITIERILAARPYEVFQIEGHTDAVGADRYNLGLSRQRATAVKDALTKYFLIPQHALITVGLGERYLKIPTQLAESENRRVTVRRITPLLRQ